MAAITVFSNDILADLPGCPSPYMLRLVRRVVRDFCKRTHCDQADDTISVVASTQSYTISDPTGKEVIALTKVEDSDEKPYNDYFYDPPTFKLDDDPTEAFTLTIRYALRPDQTVTTIDDIIYDNYYEAIIAGVKGIAMMEFQKPYSNPPGGAYATKLYEQYVRKAKNDLSKEFTNKDQRVQLINWV